MLVSAVVGAGPVLVSRTVLMRWGGGLVFVPVVAPCELRVRSRRGRRLMVDLPVAQHPDQRLREGDAEGEQHQQSDPTANGHFDQTWAWNTGRASGSNDNFRVAKIYEGMLMQARTRSDTRVNRGKSDAGADSCETRCVDEVKVQRIRRAMKPAETFARLAETFRVLGDPTRISIAWALSEDELCVHDLATLLDLSQSAVSHSLRALRQLRLVRYRKVGKSVFYALDDEHIAHLLREGMHHVDEAT